MEIPVIRNVLEANEKLSARLKEHFARHGILTLNLISSPGAGKTSLLERTLADLSPEFRMPAILMPLSPSLKYPAVRVTGLKNGMIGSVRLSAPNAAHQTNKTHVLRLNISCLKRYARYPVSMHTFSFQEGWS